MHVKLQDVLKRNKMKNLILLIFLTVIGSSSYANCTQYCSSVCRPSYLDYVQYCVDSYDPDDSGYQSCLKDARDRNYECYRDCRDY